MTKSDSEVDQTITAVDKMKGDRTGNRVTVYYLLAEHFGKLSTFARSPDQTLGKPLSSGKEEER